MCVHAHPDDESSKGAATMARYVREGDTVEYETPTGRTMKVTLVSARPFTG